MPNESKHITREEVENCSHFGRNGHNRDGCFKRIGYPDWWPSKTKQDKNKTKAAFVESTTSPILGLSNEHYQKLIKHFAKDEPRYNITPTINMVGKVEIDDVWVVDSGATEHITYQHELLENKTSNPSEPSVTIPNGDLVSVEGKGNFTLHNGNKIEGVLHIPSFNYNLLSVSRLTRDL